jgi:dsDNA-specific endonuclease/ATPase MutS2
MEFEAIPGVGPKTAAALAEFDGAEQALRDGDVAALARVSNLSEGRAARVARGAIRYRHDDQSEFLTTDRAKELYREILGLLKDRAVTEYATKRMSTFYPTASQARIEEVREQVTAATELDPDLPIRDALSELAPLEDPSPQRVRDRCLATHDAERYTAAESAFPELSIEIVEDTRGLAELARSYSTVVTPDESFAGIDIEGDVRVRPDAFESPDEIVPERVLSFFAHNREAILAATRIYEDIPREPPCNLSHLRGRLELLTADGTVRGDTELQRLATAIDDLDVTVSTAESVANDRLRAAIEERDVTIEGTDFLSLVEQGARVDSLFGRELDGEYDAAVEAARTHLIEAIDLKPDEVDLLTRVFPPDPTFPVEHNETVVSRLRTELTANRDRRAARRKRELASDLSDLRTVVNTLVEEALELDVQLALARFVDDFDCCFPTFRSDPPGFSFEQGCSPFLDLPFDRVEPVDYHASGVTLLSGVNSGGKTSTLDLIALIVILAHMGFPVPAGAVALERFTELHYYAKNQGTLDAGAFESTLREFRNLVDGQRNRLVLVDELESITEPGASAKIIAGILESLSEQGVTAVFVSHLADEIQEASAAEVAVDGIEAVGLKNGELIVNRSPMKGHLARSTPELIVEKLAGEDESGFYDQLLEKF